MGKLIHRSDPGSAHIVLRDARVRGREVFVYDLLRYGVRFITPINRIPIRRCNHHCIERVGENVVIPHFMQIGLPVAPSQKNIIAASIVVVRSGVAGEYLRQNESGISSCGFFS